MAEEETTSIREITLSPYGRSTVDELIRLLRDLTPKEKTHLVLHFVRIDGFRLSDTLELRELVLEKKSHIQRLEVYDGFEYFVQLLWANNGETKHFKCFNLIEREPIQLERVNRLSDAIRSNNDGNIESFLFSGCCDSSQVFQPVWDALLTTGVQELKLFFFHFSESNNVNGDSNTIDFSNIATNTSLKELELGSTLCGTNNLFESIKGNTTVEKLNVRSQYGAENLDNRGKKAFLEMLVNNTTLRQVELKDGNLKRILQEEIHIHTTLNQIWKRLIILKQKERMAAATATVAARRTITTTNVAASTAIDDDDDATVERRREQDHNSHEVEKMKKMAEEKKLMKKKKEMNLWLKTFEKKPVICNELIYLFLTENADMYNTNVTSSMVVGEKRKRKRYKNNVTI